MNTPLEGYWRKVRIRRPNVSGWPGTVLGAVRRALVGARWTLSPRAAAVLVACAAVGGFAAAGAALVAFDALHHIYVDRRNLPDLGPVTRFEFPAIGRIYDAGDRPLIEFAREYREISVPGGRARAPKWISNCDGRFRGLIPIREALAESRNTVAVWLAGQVGIGRVLRMARILGVETPLVLAPPFVIRQVVRGPDDVIPGGAGPVVPVALNPAVLALIQEGLRGVVRLPTGTAYALNSRAFPVAVMGKTGTTNDYRDALFVGSTYGAGGITVAVRIGFDDNHSLGSGETGGRAALPVFREVLLRVYGDGLVGPAPAFPRQMEQRISRYLQGEATVLDTDTATRSAPIAGRR